MTARLGLQGSRKIEAKFTRDETYLIARRHSVGWSDANRERVVQRLDQSYEDEKQLMDLLQQVLVAHGFTDVRPTPRGQMNLIDGRAVGTQG